MKKRFLNNLMQQKEKAKKVLEMMWCWLKNISKNQGILRYKFLVINMEIMYTWMRETALYKEDIKKWLRKLLHQLILNLEHKLEKQLWVLPKRLVIIMQEQLNSFLIHKQANFILWKWTQDYKLSIQSLRWLQDLT
jgi:hypothetical protein